MPTPNYGWTTPSLGDAPNIVAATQGITDADATVYALSQDVLRMESGYVTDGLISDETDYPITYTKTYTEAPIVLTGTEEGQFAEVSILNRTTTGCTVRVRPTTGAQSTIVRVRWLAAGAI